MAFFSVLLLMQTIFTLQQQMQLIPVIKYRLCVQHFTKEKGLQLCVDIVITRRNEPRNGLSLVGLPVQDAVKCGLGVWWYSNSVEERICKAHAAFFSQGDLGSFHGQLNPLSSRSLIESCVMPVLMYGSECWCLNATLLSKLESLQADLGKRILRLPRYTANSVPLMALRWSSMRCRCLCAKLTFLHKVCSRESDTLSCKVYKSLSFSDVESMMLVKQCRYLELQYSTNQ